MCPHLHMFCAPVRSISMSCDVITWVMAHMPRPTACRSAACQVYTPCAIDHAIVEAVHTVYACDPCCAPSMATRPNSASLTATSRRLHRCAAIRCLRASPLADAVQCPVALAHEGAAARALVPLAAQPIEQPHARAIGVRPHRLYNVTLGRYCPCVRRQRGSAHSARASGARGSRA